MGVGTLSIAVAVTGGRLAPPPPSYWRYWYSKSRRTMTSLHFPRNSGASITPPTCSLRVSLTGTQFLTGRSNLAPGLQCCANATTPNDKKNGSLDMNVGQGLCVMGHGQPR